MTDIEIDKALALAIGWKAQDIDSYEDVAVWWCDTKWRVFSHRDWNVIGPIAARYDCFPSRFRNGTRTEWGAYSTAYGFADTPQRAIALAVIGALK